MADCKTKKAVLSKTPTKQKEKVKVGTILAKKTNTSRKGTFKVWERQTHRETAQKQAQVKVK